MNNNNVVNSVNNNNRVPMATSLPINPTRAQKIQKIKNTPIETALSEAFDELSKLGEFVDVQISEIFPKPKKGDTKALENIKLGYFIRAHLTFKQLCRVYAGCYRRYKDDPAKLLLVGIAARISLLVAIPFILLHRAYNIRNKFLKNLEEYGKTTRFSSH